MDLLSIGTDPIANHLNHYKHMLQGIREPLSQKLCLVNDGEYDFCLSFLQTFVNDLRIPEQTYITLKLSDVIRFGYDILSFLFLFYFKQLAQSKFVPRKNFLAPHSFLLSPTSKFKHVFADY